MAKSILAPPLRGRAPPPNIQRGVQGRKNVVHLCYWVCGASLSCCTPVVILTALSLPLDRKLLSLSLFANAHSRDVLVRASVLVSSYNPHITALKASSYTSPAMRCARCAGSKKRAAASSARDRLAAVPTVLDRDSCEGPSRLA
ncbi:hypothetical protein DFH06DRAFT_1488781, partial [Mycena polygramma]